MNQKPLYIWDFFSKCLKQWKVKKEKPENFISALIYGRPRAAANTVIFKRRIRII
jgi:hypothetical protein